MSLVLIYESDYKVGFLYIIVRIYTDTVLNINDIF